MSDVMSDAILRWCVCFTGLVLLLVDVLTDVIDMLGNMSVQVLAGGSAQLNELMAKKISLLGVMSLVAVHKWRQHGRIAQNMSLQLPSHTPPANGKPTTTLAPLPSERPLLSSAALLCGRILIAFLFVHVGSFELHRLVFTPAEVTYSPHTLPFTPYPPSALPCADAFRLT